MTKQPEAEAARQPDEVDVIAQILAHWFTQGGSSQFGDINGSNADEVVSSILCQVRARIEPLEAERDHECHEKETVADASKAHIEWLRNRVEALEGALRTYWQRLDGLRFEMQADAKHSRAAAGAVTEACALIKGYVTQIDVLLVLFAALRSGDRATLKDQG